MATEDAEGASPLPADAIGARLKQARTRLGLTREKCAERMYLEPSTIDALENEQFQLLGAGVYARGHLRRYAELLGEDPREFEQLMARRAGAGGAPDLARIVTQPMTAPTQGTKIGVWPVAAVAAVLVFAAVIRWAMNSKRPVATTNVTTVVAPSGESASAASPAAAPAPAPVVPTATTAPTARAAVAKAIMKVSFLGDGWLEVNDASGKRLYAEQGRSGSVVSLEGQAPLRMVAGNVTALAIDLNGRRVRLPENIPAGQNVQLSLTADGQASPK